jgi:hypothetical protein
VRLTGLPRLAGGAALVAFLPLLERLAKFRRATARGRGWVSGCGMGSATHHHLPTSTRPAAPLRVLRELVRSGGLRGLACWLVVFARGLTAPVSVRLDAASATPPRVLTLIHSNSEFWGRESFCRPGCARLGWCPAASADMPSRESSRLSERPPHPGGEAVQTDNLSEAFFVYLAE